MSSDSKCFSIRVTPGRIRNGIALGVFLVALLAFSGRCFPASIFAKFQVGPILLSAMATSAKGALASLLAVVIVTLLFGRIFCSLLCPLGTLQDGIYHLVPKRKRMTKNIPNVPVVRYVLAGGVYALLFAGFAFGFLVLDPYTTFGRIATTLTTVTVGGLLPLGLLIALALWKKRLFCTAICPVGTLLGLLSKHPVVRLHLQPEDCVQCNLCARLCPTGCIDPKSHRIDSERCLLCLQCLDACPKKAISFRMPKEKPEKCADAHTLSRREFLLGSAALLGGSALGLSLSRSHIPSLPIAQKAMTFLPPGAGGAERFATKCTGCGLCIAACPAHLLVPSASGLGPIHLDPTRGVCGFDCNACSRVCPTGAIPRLALHEKQSTPIALAVLNAAHCQVFQDGTPCGKCASICPKEAITLRKNGTPRPIQAATCIGCGACAHACPGYENTKAITIAPLSPIEQLPF